MANKESEDDFVEKLQNLSIQSEHTEIRTFDRRLKTGLVYYERMVDHYCIWDPDYPESPQRFTAILDRITELGLKERCKPIAPRKATEDEILLIHEKQHFDEMRKTADIKDATILEEISSKYDAVYFTPNTFDLSLYSVGCVLNLVQSTINNEIRNGFALIRPPGHHALANEPCGYCFFNNVAIAAKYAVKNLRLKRVLIVDWDVHHGQASQYAFYDDPSVLYFSFHRYDEGSFWPELIESNYNFVGTQNAKGFNVNVPLNEESLHNGDFLAIWTNILLPIAFEFNPELVLISAGYDAAIGCPEGEMLITPAMYAHLCHSLMSLANGKVCVVLEGGYCISSLAESAALTLRTLLGDPCPNIGNIPYPLHNALVKTVLDVIWAQRPFWNLLCLQGTFTKGDQDLMTFDNVRRRHTPIVEYKGKAALLPKPTKYETRNCYVVNKPEIRDKYEIEIKKLIATTCLDVPSKRTSIIFNNESEKHKTKSHPERPDRVFVIIEQLSKDKLLERCHIIESSRSASDDTLLLAHTEKLIKKLRNVPALSSEELSDFASSFNDIYFTQESYEIAKLAVGKLLDVVDLVLSHQCLNGFAVLRPPGHHATPDKCSGFCILNNVAIAAKYAIDKYNLKRLLIVDWDIHHGDGTQKIVEDDERILFISLHRYDNATYFPAHWKAGFKTKKNIINIPWNDGPMGDADYLLAFCNIVLPIAYNFNPELVLVSSGFDAAINDPLGHYEVSPAFYGHMVHMLSSLANGKLIVSLEGGYNLKTIAECAMHTVSALLGDPPSAIDKLKVNQSAIITLRDVIDYHASNWPCLAFNADLPDTEVSF
ncbi:histone deacetylase 6-like isoform X3 [Dinothrombium tinctorium]|uniref:Histone deacetylase 6-like isoform X3 n=1 Tax=Dinothrombium tinctorium TaxID=1965070 RepID=A0A443RPJ1_9ACAR|nr:histone deacetylase 6-like isoform X3 [Dinothrombium tinctorium]